MRVAVINASHYGMKPADHIYNLAVEKIANYHRLYGDEVYAGRWESMLNDYDKYYFSVIFTWDIPGMIQAVNLVRTWGKEVEIGGPAATFMHKYIHTQTGIEPHIGLDQRFEHISRTSGGTLFEYQMTFTSRGCPHRCQFCGVKRVEPFPMEYDDYPMAPMVGDNNILATSPMHQLRFVNKYVKYGKKVDINSGFDVRFFHEREYDLYSQLNLLCWRFAFDSMDVWEDVWRVGTMMRHKGLDRHHVMFYCLIGFPGQCPDEARFRLDTIRDMGHMPYPMRFIPLNSLSHKYVAHGWNEDILFRLQTYYQTPNLWKADKFENFRPGKNVVEISPEQGSML